MTETIDQFVARRAKKIELAQQNAEKRRKEQEEYDLKMEKLRQLYKESWEKIEARVNRTITNINWQLEPAMISLQFSMVDRKEDTDYIGGYAVQFTPESQGVNNWLLMFISNTDHEYVDIIFDDAASEAPQSAYRYTVEEFDDEKINQHLLEFVIKGEN